MGEVLAVSRPVPIYGARQYENKAPEIVVFANGRQHQLTRGEWVVEYGPGDVGVLSDGEYRRYFGGG